MDPAPITSPNANAPFNPQPDVSITTKTNEKRAAENGEDPEMKSKKRARIGAEGKEGKRVAEIVLVLSAMWRMRGGGGKGPTEVERRLMAEAREKLVDMCEGLAPKDIVARDAIVGLIEDLGLNGRVKEQKLGFRGQRLSIKEKVELSKRKMEEPKKFSTQPTAYTSNSLQTSFGTAPENRGTSHTVRMFPLDKVGSSPTLSSGGFSTSSPPVHVHATTSASLPYQLPNNDARPPTVSIGLPSSHLGRDSSSLALPRVEKPQVKLDGGSNGSSYVSQVQANASANHPLVNAPTWSVQPQSASSAKAVLENKVPNHIPLKLEGPADMSRTAPQAVRDQSFRPFISQTGNMPNVHQPLQGTNIVQAPQFGSNHGEIAKIVQKLLHPKLPQHPTWTPPSREYMSKAFTCQICKLTANEVETVVLCDACEKGFHLKCLQMNNQKGIPRGGEWHCMSCLKLSNGKPLPPKYGRVMRSINTTKMPSNTSVIQSPSDKKFISVDQKVNNQQKITVNGSSGGSGALGSNSNDSDLKIHNIRATQGGNLVSSTKSKDQETSSGTYPSNVTKPLGVVPPPGDSHGPIQSTQVCESSTQLEKLASESKSEHPAISSETVSNHSAASQPSHNSQVVRTDLANSAEVSLKNSHDSSSTIKQDEEVVGRLNPVGNSVISSDALHNVQWIGDVLQIVDGKKFYQSCRIGGVTYKVKDHVLLHSSNNKLMPSKLQTMWEDTGTGSKWVMVNRCFFPGDLPEAVGCPCAPESNELYESNNESSVMAGLIRGPCEVLPPGKFKEENERLNHLGNEANKGRHPVFLCQWFYDELKGVFRPVSG